MPCKDVLDCVRQEGPIPKSIGLKVVEGPRDGGLLEGMGLVCGAELTS